MTRPAKHRASSSYALTCEAPAGKRPRARELRGACTRDRAASRRKARVDKNLGSGASAAQLLEAAGWPNAKCTVLIVGHQPPIGAATALALTDTPAEWRVKKGAIWWIAIEDGERTPRVRAVLASDML